MPIATVNLTLLDGALGALPTNTQGDVAIVAGPATSGPFLSPALFARPADIQKVFGAGPLVEYASLLTYRSGNKPVIVVRTHTTTDGGYGALDDTGITGACVPTADPTFAPYDEYDAYCQIVVGGTVGSAGITYQTSLDGGRTLGPVLALGTATSITIAAGNVKWNLTSASLTAGDFWVQRTTAPLEGSTDLTDAMTVMQACRQAWQFATFASHMTAAMGESVMVWLDAMFNGGKRRAARICTRGPAVGEADADWQTSIIAEWTGATSKRCAVSAGYAEFQSALPGAAQYRRPAGWITTSRALSPNINPTRNDLGQVNLGNLGADVKISDSQGNPKPGLHDESINPGLDAMGFETLTSLPGLPGVYCTTPKVLCPIGSDFYLWQYVECINRAAEAVDLALLLRCRAPIEVDSKTGYITSTEAEAINSAVNAAVQSAVGGSVSGASFQVSRTDNLLQQNAFVTGQETIIPLAYPAGFNVTIGFSNPANGTAV